MLEKLTHCYEVKKQVRAVELQVPTTELLDISGRRCQIIKAEPSLTSVDPRRLHDVLYLQVHTKWTEGLHNRRKRWIFMHRYHFRRCTDMSFLDGI